MHTLYNDKFNQCWTNLWRRGKEAVLVGEGGSGAGDVVVIRIFTDQDVAFVGSGLHCARIPIVGKVQALSTVVKLKLWSFENIYLF